MSWITKFCDFSSSSLRDLEVQTDRRKDREAAWGATQLHSVLNSHSMPDAAVESLHVACCMCACVGVCVRMHVGASARAAAADVAADVATVRAASCACARLLLAIRSLGGAAAERQETKRK